MDALISDLIHFLNAAPTAWHAVAYMRKKLEQAGFLELKEDSAWKLTAGEGYFVVRDGASLCAFIAPQKAPSRLHLIGTHSDSPAFKLKPKAAYYQNNTILLAIAPYGAPLLNSWLNRDLGIAGKVVYCDRQGLVKETLVELDTEAVVIPQLAIHLDRKIDEQGLLLNKQDHLIAVAGITDDAASACSYLEKRLEAILPPATLLAHDLFLYPLETARRVGAANKLLAAARLDNLMSAHAALHAFLSLKRNDYVDAIPMVAFWNHEEIGSYSASGAHSPFLGSLIERLALQYGQGREELFQLIARSLCLSVDLSHAIHPAYQDRHDPQHRPLLGKGVVLKTSAQQRYAGAAPALGAVAELCMRYGIPFQLFAPRNDLPSGSTIGPIHAATTGMATVDIGIAQLSMHACRELACCDDQVALCQLLRAFLSIKGT